MTLEYQFNTWGQSTHTFFSQNVILQTKLRWSMYYLDSEQFWKNTVNLEIIYPLYLCLTGAEGWGYGRDMWKDSI